MREPTTFAAALGAAIERSGHSLSSLQRTMHATGNPVSISTLSYWRSGARHPEGAQSRVAVEELERILSLSRGTLLDLVAQTRRPGQVTAPGHASSDEHERTLSEVLSALDADPLEIFREVSSSTIASVGRGGHLQKFVSRCLIQATTRRLRSIPIAFPVDEAASSLPRIFAVRGGRITHDYAHPNGTMIGARLDLPDSLNAPDRTVIEFGFELPEDYPPQFAVMHGATRKATEIAISVEFPPTGRPDWINEFEERDDGLREFDPEPLNKDSAVVVRHRFGPGYVGLRWGFTDDSPIEGEATNAG